MEDFGSVCTDVNGVFSLSMKTCPWGSPRILSPAPSVRKDHGAPEEKKGTWNRGTKESLCKEEEEERRRRRTVGQETWELAVMPTGVNAL